MRRIISLLFLLMFISGVAFADANYLNLPAGEIASGPEFRLTHRFFGILGQSDFLGLDSGANVGLGFGMKIRENMDFSFLRLSINQEYVFSGKIKINNLLSCAVGANHRSSAAVTQNKTGFFAQAIFSRSAFDDRFSFSIVPGFAAASDANNTSAAENDTLALGAAASFSHRINRGYLEEFELQGELVPVLSGYRLRYPTISVGIKLKTWGHVFSLLLTNVFANSPAGYLAGSDTNNVYFGFNLVRKFNL